MAFLNVGQLKQVVHTDGLQRKAKALLLLATLDPPVKVQQIEDLAAEVGLREVRGWNTSSILASCRGLAIRGDLGWELHQAGMLRVRELAAGAQVNLVVTTASHSLRVHLAKVPSPHVRAFVEEAIICFEAKQFKAAVVFSWVGAVAMLYEHVVANVLADFNREAQRRDRDWKTAKTADDLGKMREHDFLNVLEALSVIGKNVKQTLQNHCLQLRNSCGHPNTLSIGENIVAAHIEKLILNVFSKF